MRHLALLLSLTALSSCLQPEAVKVEPMAPVLEKMAEVGDLEAQVALLNTKIERMRVQFGGKNDNLTTWLGMASGPVCLIYYLWIHRPIRRKLQNGKGPQ